MGVEQYIRTPYAKTTFLLVKVHPIPRENDYERQMSARAMSSGERKHIPGFVARKESQSNEDAPKQRHRPHEETKRGKIWICEDHDGRRVV